MRAVVLLLVLGSFVAALPRNEQERIIGGSSVSIERFPFMASLSILYDDWYLEQACGGALLTSVSVLTSGWCFVYESSPSSWRVRLGSASSSGGGSLHSVQHYVLHPNFNATTRENDVAMIRLTTPAVFSDVIRVARIAGINYNLADGTAISAVGWGINMRSNSDMLLHREISTVNQEVCVNRYANISSSWLVSDNSLCAGAAIGPGDYGGPLIHQGDVIVGVMSFAYFEDGSEYPSVSTRVSRYSDWIVANA